MPTNFRIVQDEDPQDPLKESDNLISFVAVHPRYWFGNCGIKTLGDYNAYVRQNHADLTWAAKHGLVRKVYLYDHSGLALRLDSPQGFPDIQWDVSRIGFIWVSRQKILEWFQVTKVHQVTIDKAKAVMEAEFQTYADYIAGDSWILESQTADGEWAMESEGPLREMNDEKLKREAELGKGV